MKITKLGHCCLLIEHNKKRILTDPGAWTTAQNELKNIDVILITHEHPDHLHLESVEILLKNNPKAVIITNTAVGSILSGKNISSTTLEDGQNKVVDTIFFEAFGDKHQEIYKEIGMVQNTGYFIDNHFFYPGDAFTNPGKPVSLLALPIAGTWMKFKDAMEYALEVKPKVAFPVHDGMLLPGRSGPIYSAPQKVLESHQIQYLPLKEGESFES